MRKHTPADARNDLLLLGEYEADGGPSLRELAAREGQSHVHIWRRLERARVYRQRWRDEELIREAVRKGDIPWVEITTRSVEGYHYLLGADQRSRLPGGVFRIGTGKGGLRIAHASDGQPLDGQPKKEPAKFRPRNRKGKRKRALIDT